MIKQKGKYHTIKYVIFYNFYFLTVLGNYFDFKLYIYILIYIHMKIDDFYSHTVCFTRTGKYTTLKGRIHVQIDKI